MVKIRAERAQDGPSFNAAQYPSYHTYTNTFSEQLQTYYDPAKSEHP